MVEVGQLEVDVLKEWCVWCGVLVCGCVGEKEEEFIFKFVEVFDDSGVGGSMGACGDGR